MNAKRKIKVWAVMADNGRWHFATNFRRGGSPGL
jgi:hypothetical protein